MTKMRILIATRGDRRSTLARALGINQARPTVEVGGAHDRESLFEALRGVPWHTLVIDEVLAGAPANELLIAAAELLHSTRIIILAASGTIANPGVETHSADDVPGLADRILNSPTPVPPSAPTQTRTDPETGLPACDTLAELLAHDGRRPRTGLLSFIAIHAGGGATPEAARIITQSLGEGGIACRWNSVDILVLRRAASPGEALVWAERVRALLAHSALGITWVRASELRDTAINQADHALRVALTRETGVCSWTSVVALRLAEQIAAAGADHETRRETLLHELSSTLGPVQREQLTSHSEEVAEAASTLARLLRLSDDECQRVRLAALCHDLGKIAIPDDLLAKPGPLSPLQRRVMDRHAEEGACLCKALGLDPAIAAIVRHHHTRFDSLEAAPDAARIVAVADAMVTMTSARPYSPARSFSYALAELRRCRGTMFDPRAVVAAHILGASHMRAAA